MRLFEHPDFDQAILQAAEHFQARGLRPAIIEKDYFVTEALRIIAAEASDRVIFKGGTSLSKGWDLIDRFSEDIDLFLDPQSFDPPLGKKAIDRELKKLRDAISASGMLAFEPQESRTIGGFGHSDRFSYDQRFGGPGEIAGRVLLEAGTASGREPTAERPLRSFLGQFLEETNQSLGAEDESPFPMRLLHFRRTFVEKLFAIHGKIELFKQGQPLGGYARHYYDLHQLANQDEVRSMLASDEYGVIKNDYDAISRRSFGRDYACPEGMSFVNSDAIFPQGQLAESIKHEYEAQCLMLCYGSYPDWDSVQARFEALRDLL